jgi:hypothetical protein
MVAILTMATQAQAQALYVTNFAGANGSYPANWTNVTDPYGQMNIQSDSFRIVRPSLPSGSGSRSMAVFNGLDINGNASTDWTDVTILTRLQGTHFNINSSSVTQGVVARYDATASSWGYTASLWQTGIAIYANTSSLETQQGTRLGTNSLSQNLATNTWYWLEFSLQGTTLTARAFTDISGAVGDEFGFLQLNDSTFTAGTAGVRAGFTGDNSVRSISYDSFQVVPEPRTAALLLAALAFMAYRRIRSRG